MCGGDAVTQAFTKRTVYKSRTQLGGAIQSSVNSFLDIGYGAPYRFALATDESLDRSMTIL